MTSQVPAASRACARQLTRSSRQVRLFSQSASRRRNGPIAAFPETSNPKLDELLDTLRNTVFLPNHLNTDQRRLIYRKNWQHYLTGEEPVRVKVPTTFTGGAPSGEEDEFVLRPLSMLTDEPRHSQSLNAIVEELARVPENWAKVLPPLLRELHLSKRKVRVHDVEKIVRRAGEGHALGVVIQCLQRAESLGFKLHNSSVASKILFHSVLNVGKEGWGLGADGTATDATARKRLDSAIANFKNLLRLIQDDKQVADGTTNAMKTAPELYGAAVLLVAVRRLLWQTENTPEKVAARQAAASETSASASESETPEVEPTSGEEKAVETPDGEIPAAEATADATATGESAEPAEVFPLGRDDEALMVEWSTQMLELSESADLEFDPTDRQSVHGVLARWLPVWMAVVATRQLLPASSPLAARLGKAFEAEIDPQVRKALEARKALFDGKLANFGRMLNEFGTLAERTGKIDVQVPV